MLLNGGVDPQTNMTIVPAATLANMTTARGIENGAPAGDVSIVGYGMGWYRMSYKGHDVSRGSLTSRTWNLLTRYLYAGRLA